MIVIKLILFYRLCFEKATLEWLADVSDGDARIALTNLQYVLQHYQFQNKKVTIDDVREQIKVSIIIEGV